MSEDHLERIAAAAADASLAYVREFLKRERRIRRFRLLMCLILLPAFMATVSLEFYQGHYFSGICSAGNQMLVTVAVWLNMTQLIKSVTRERQDWGERLVLTENWLKAWRTKKEKGFE